MKLFLKRLWAVVSFKKWRTKGQLEMRRQRYEDLKYQISQRHFNGFAGLVIEDSRFDRTDMSCFRAPMYGTIKNKDGQWCIFWDRSRMAQEIGVGAPLKDGEVMAVPETKGRAKLWQKTEDEVDEQQALVQKVPVDGETV